MDDVLRAIAVYGLLMTIFRLTGKRSMADTTPFDFILLLIFSEALQSALVDNDNSLTVAFVVILTLVVLNIGMSLLKQRFHFVELLMEGAPITIVEDGQLLRDRMRRARVDEGDVLGEAGGGEEPPERVGGQLAGVEEPVDGPVQGELGRRPGEDEQDRIGIAPDGPDDRAGANEGRRGGGLAAG